MKAFRLPVLTMSLLASLAACTPAPPSKAPEASAVVSSSDSVIASAVAVTTSKTIPAAFVGKWDAPPKPCGKAYRSDVEHHRRRAHLF